MRTIKITEQTIRELSSAIKTGKARNVESILVSPYYGKTQFEIKLELTPHTMESRGYRIKKKP